GICHPHAERRTRWSGMARSRLERRPSQCPIGCEYRGECRRLLESARRQPGWRHSHAGAARWADRVRLLQRTELTIDTLMRRFEMKKIRQVSSLAHCLCRSQFFRAVPLARRISRERWRPRSSQWLAVSLKLRCRFCIAPGPPVQLRRRRCYWRSYARLHAQPPASPLRERRPGLPTITGRSISHPMELRRGFETRTSKDELTLQA